MGNKQSKQSKDHSLALVSPQAAPKGTKIGDNALKQQLAVKNTITESQQMPQKVVKLWKWDSTSNKDHRLNVAHDSMTVTMTPKNYIDSLTFSTIFLDNWISKDGRYYFKFRFHGQLIGSSNEVAIGVISDKYDIGNPLGIGADQHGWSWYVYDAHWSYTYYKTFVKQINYGLSDGGECMFEIVIKNGSCKTYLHYVAAEGVKPEVIQYQTIPAPVKIGVSMNSGDSPLSLEITDQEISFTT